MTYKEATRVHTSILAAAEKKALVWLAARLPGWVNSDHLTVLAGLAMAGAGLCYWAGTPAALLGAIVFLGVNWFGDSLDGTLARVRHHERPRYGFYVDHVLDVVGILLLVAGLFLGGHVSGAAAAAFMLAYYLLMIEIALATHAVGTFRISYWKFGPTELRILLAVGTLQLLRSDVVTVAGHRILLFDLGMVIGAIAIVATFVSSVALNTRTLYRAEPLPRAEDSGNAPGTQSLSRAMISG